MEHSSIGMDMLQLQAQLGVTRLVRKRGRLKTLFISDETTCHVSSD